MPLAYYIIYHNLFNDNNQYKVIICPLYVNILPKHKFDTSILSLIPKEIVNQLRQMIYEFIEIYKSVLDATIKLHQ